MFSKFVKSLSSSIVKVHNFLDNQGVYAIGDVFSFTVGLNSLAIAECASTNAFFNVGDESEPFSWN